MNTREGFSSFKPGDNVDHKGLNSVVVNATENEVELRIPFLPPQLPVEKAFTWTAPVKDVTKVQQKRREKVA